MKTITIALFALAAFGANAGAGDDTFLFDGSVEESLPSAWQPIFELQFRQDAMRDLPRPVDADFDRWEARARIGAEWWPTENFLLKAIGRAFGAQQDNEHMASNLDNERLRDIAVDELYLETRWDAVSVRLGQSDLPFELSPMIWDRDLRWRGFGLQFTDDGVRHVQGAAALGGRIDHAFGSRAELAGLQWRWRINHAGGATQFHLAGLAFNELETLPQTFRTNSRVLAGSGLATEFRIADLQFAQTFGVGDSALRIGVDMARNLEATTAGEAGRIDLRYGNAGGFGGFEIGAAAQRIQADAVPAAFNDDDWWFPTRMRGHAFWMAWGFDADWQLRVAVFREKRDGMREYTQRGVMDVSFRF